MQKVDVIMFPATTEAAIDANAPLQDEVDTNGPVDSDEEKDLVMAGIARSNPRPLVTHSFMTTKTKYRFVRLRDQLSHASGGRKGNLFSTEDHPLFGGDLFQPYDPEVDASSSPMIPSADPTDAIVSADGLKNTPVQGVRKASVTT